MKSRWKTYLLYGGLVLVVVSTLYFIVETIQAKNTGFETKTLWDWMELLIIPLFLAGGAYYLNRTEKEIERKSIEERAKLERENAKDSQREAALQAYIDKTSELLLKELLLTTEKTEVRDVARTRTISVMRGLDTKRNDLVIQFLREARLIIGENSILKEANMKGMDLQKLNLNEVNLTGAKLHEASLSDANLSDANLSDANLSGADLSGAYLLFAKLSGADLSGADLSEANLFEADLSGAYLSEANLSGVNLSEANLFEAYLSGADLTKANLSGANLREANLDGADLSGADLRGANLDGADLSEAKYNKEAKWPDGFDPNEAGAERGDL